MNNLYRAAIVIESLEDVSILSGLSVLETETIEDWTILTVEIPSEELSSLQTTLKTGPWYIHAWNTELNSLVIIYKDKIFTVSLSDTFTWNDAIAHGAALGIPEEQLDFLTSE